MFKSKLSKFAAAVAVTLMGVVAPQLAQASDYPNKPIRVVVPFPPGVTTDIVARTLAEALHARLGQPVIVENKAGADGSIGVVDVMRSKPDGYSLMVVTNGPMSVVPHLRKPAPYDVVTDFTPIADIGRPTFAVFVSSELPVNTLPEFVQYVKDNPGKLNYASGNLTGQLSFAYITMTEGLDMTHIPYKGETNAMTDILGGHVEAIVATTGTGIPLVNEGRLKMLAVISGERSAELPDVPLISEVGFPEFPIQSWYGLFGPAGMDPEVVKTLNEATTDALKDPKVIERLHSIRAEITPSTPEGLAAFLRQQLDNHGKLIRDAGITPQ